MEPQTAEQVPKQRTMNKQVIDDSRNFNRQALEEIIKHLGPDVQKNYYSVAIIGVQNSGKSTLLNQLFGTQFDVLKAMAGSRTTRGIWLSLDMSQNFLVLDVEGNDAMDRAQEQDYQKMVATYALVTANVLIINIWCKSLGGYTGSQYQTLKVIMDICISQFKHQSPKTILFCVRDFNNEYDQESQIRSKILMDVRKLWRDIEKPQQLKEYEQKPEKFFNIEVCCLRRYRQAKKQAFIQDVKKLRKRFVDSKSSDYIFSNQDSRFNLPIADLPQLAQNSWKSISSNKKLNLPNQKDQLASFRCSTISAEIEQHFEQKMQKLQEDKLVGNYGQIRNQFIKQYDHKTYHYGKKISSEKKQALLNYIDDHIKRVLVEKLSIQQQQINKQFLQQTQNIKSNPSIPLDLQLRNLLQRKIQDFIIFMKNMNYEIPNRKEHIQELSKKLNDKFSQIRQNMNQQAMTEFQNQSSRVFRLLGSQVIKNYFGYQFWPKTQREFINKNNQLLQSYSQKFNWINGESLNAVAYDNLMQNNQNVFQEVVKNQLQKCLENKAFDFYIEHFKRQEDSNDQINFNLKTQQEIAQHFDKTRDKVMLLLNQLNQVNGNSRRSSFIDFQGNDAQKFFESTWFSTVTEKIDKKMIQEYQKVMRRKKEGQMNIVPWWLYVVILYFFYDDIWFTQQESPIMHYSILVIVLACSTLVAIGQGKVLKEIMRIFSDFLKEKIPFLR